MVDISKINKKIAIFIVFLTLVALWGLFVKVPVEDTKPDYELKVGGLHMQFKNGTSESEVKSILQNYNMTRNYRITFDANHYPEYYIMADKDNWSDIRRELVTEMKENNKKNWTISTPAHVIRKEDYYVLPVSEQAIQDEKFLAILDRYDIGVKKFIWCDIRFLYSDGPLTYWIPEEDATKIKNELELNENIFTVQLSYLYP